jgi:flagellar M-ring protein FliF
MPAAVKQLWERAFAQFRTFTVAQRIGMVGAAVAVVVGVLLFSRWSGTPDMAALYTDLAPTDAAAITERLSSKGVGYELADQGTTVKVPRDQLYDLRLEMSASGIPSGGSGGWSILDDQGITTSEFSQQVGYQRAMEGELARTVAALDVVDSATVHLVLPKRDAFVLDETKASASVLIRTRPGRSLTSSQVQAVVNLVSSSVQGLTTDAVTVADTAGNVLNAPGQELGGTAGNTRIEQTSVFESSLSSEIESLLSSVVGPGRAVVTVNADLDFDKSTATSETFSSPTADGQPLTDSESSRTEEYQGAVPGNAGVLGPTPGTSTEGSDTSYRLDESSSDNALNRVVETTERAPGAIERLSVAVLVDEDSVGDAQLVEIEELVSAAAGVDAGRGDQIVVTRLPFDTSIADASESELAALDAQQEREAKLKLYTTIGAVVVVVTVLGFAYRAMTRSSRRRAKAQIDLRDAPARDASARAPEPAAGADETTVFGDLDTLARENGVPVAELPPPTPPSEEDLLTARLGAQVANLVEKQPDEVAVLLRTWLGDRRTVKR